MDRLSDETEYVLMILYGMRTQVIARPQLFDPDALMRMDDAIRRIEVDKQVKAA